MYPRKKSKIKRKSTHSNTQLNPSVLTEDSDINSIRYSISKIRKKKEMNEQHEEFFIQNDNNDSNSAVKESEEQQSRPQYLSENTMENLDFNSVSVATKSQWQAILNGIKSDDDETLRLQCLMELCNHLVVLTEDHLNGFKVDQFVPPLVSIIQNSQDPNLMLFVCRAFSHLLEALPTSVGHLVRNGAIPALCEKLLAVEYIDLAEQVINALLKISEIQNGAIEILKSGGLTALLTYLDFFSIDIQYKATQTATNVLSIIPNDCFDIVRDSIGLFNQLLDHQDIKVLTNACICVYRIIKALSSSKSDLNQIRDLGIVNKLINLLSIHSRNVENDNSSIADYSMRSLTILVNRDGTIIHLFFKNNLPLTLHELFEYEKKRNVRQKVKNVQSLYYIISLIDAMLPDKDTKVAQPRYYYFEKVDPEENGIKVQEYEKNPEYIQFLVQHLLQSLVEIYGVRSSVSLNEKCLSSIYKMIVASSKDILHEELKDLSFSSFIVRLLGSKDMYSVMIALHLGENLMEKLPEIFKIYFVREGVINEINQLIETNKTEDVEVEIEKPENRELKRKRSIYTKACEFKMKYFGDDEKIQREELRMFHDIAVAIKELNTPKCDRETKENTMRELLTCLNQGISTYELLQSDLINSLLEFLTYDDESLSLYERKRIRETNTSVFQSIFLSNEGKSALTSLLNECHHGIEKLDSFEADTISIHDNPIGCLKYLTRQFTLKLVPHENETTIRENIFVHAEPLASLQDVKSYLKKKLQAISEDKNKGVTDQLMEEEVSDDHINEEEEHEEEEEELEEDDELMDEEEEEEGGENIYDYLEEEEEGEFIEEDEEEIDEEDHIEEEEGVVDLSEIEKFKRTDESQKEDKPHEEEKEILKKQIKLFFKGIELDEKFNVFKTVYTMNKKSGQTKVGEFRGIHRLWSNKYEIEYLQVDEKDTSTVAPAFSMDTDHFFFNLVDETVEELKSIENRTSLQNLLYLIKLIYTIISSTDPSHPYLRSFINEQLTTKVIRITQDPLLLCTGVLPDWMFDVMSHHHHLFTLDVRMHFFRSTSLGISRTFLALKERLEDFMRLHLGRIYRQKVRIHRNKVLESAFIIFKNLSSSSILEIEYFDEVATGLGPTLEFFTLLSHEFQRRDLNLWMDHSSHDNITVDGKELCYHPFGLFPRPSKQSEFDGNDNMKKLLYHNFGCFIAKAIMDQRLIDVHLSIPLIKFLLSEPLTVHSLREIFPEICQVIEDLNEIVMKKIQIMNNNKLTDEERDNQIRSLTYKNVEIEDLSLYFVLPGFDIPLIDNGEDILVTIHNLDEYVTQMIHTLTKGSIEIQMKAIKDGFNSIFDSNNLRLFTPSEIDTMIYGSSEKHQEWDKETILENTICDHGYTTNSRAVKFIVEIMSEFTEEERRKFLRFITGSPRLPPGGFKGLSPKLTFVRKEAESPLKPDDYLPSVNTCFLYLKLPDYSSKEIMKQNLLKAIEHGQSGFALS